MKQDLEARILYGEPPSRWLRVAPQQKFDTSPSTLRESVDRILGECCALWGTLTGARPANPITNPHSPIPPREKRELIE